MQMVRSMTGYGRAQRIIDGRDITVEIKSVNHRFLEFTARVPRGCGYLEEKLKSYMQGRASRGKVEVGVQIQTVEAANTVVEVNQELAGAYIHALRELGKQYGLTDDLSVSSISRFSEIFTVRRAPEDEDAVWEAVQAVTGEAAERFLRMRELEGEASGRLARPAFAD